MSSTQYHPTCEVPNLPHDHPRRDGRRHTYKYDHHHNRVPHHATTVHVPTVRGTHTSTTTVTPPTAHPTTGGIRANVTVTGASPPQCEMWCRHRITLRIRVPTVATSPPLQMGVHTVVLPSRPPPHRLTYKDDRFVVSPPTSVTTRPHGVTSDEMTSRTTSRNRRSLPRYYIRGTSVESTRRLPCDVHTRWSNPGTLSGRLFPTKLT